MQGKYTIELMRCGLVAITKSELTKPQAKELFYHHYDIADYYPRVITPSGEVLTLEKSRKHFGLHKQKAMPDFN